VTVVGGVRAGVLAFPIRPPPGTNHAYPVTASAAVMIVTKAFPSPRKTAGPDEFISRRWGGHDLRAAETISPLSRNERGETKQTQN